MGEPSNQSRYDQTTNESEPRYPYFETYVLRTLVAMKAQKTKKNNRVDRLNMGGGESFVANLSLLHSENTHEISNVPHVYGCCGR